MRLNESNELHCICPSDELLLMRELRIPVHGSAAEVILELQSKLETAKQDLQRAEREARLQERKAAKLEAQLSHKGKTIATLQQENAGLLNMLHEEREAHEQSRVLMGKRIALASVRNDDKKPLTATQGVKNAYSGSYAERMRAKRF